MKRGMEPLIPKTGNSPDDVIQFVLDETAARAVFRAKGDPDELKETIDAPFTPLGSVVPGALHNQEIVDEYTLNEYWSPAVEALYEYIRNNAAIICGEFAGKESPWEWEDD
ncbi:hypothetical protein A3B61_03980 [Candidatus Peribacteria bacterium RIFCSPLOWO2_01_FULL_53_10]|nr:MAG: hypothetical protein A3B61_03980 [Candidatus Peribacteria bacterium RIFCSPLOWO2_01_FULL_53_10]